MEALFFYFGKVILSSGILFLYYRLFLKDKTFHHYNRFYLLAAVMISLLLPLLKVSHFTVEVNSNMYFLIDRLQNISSPNNFKNDFNYIKIGALLTGLVAVFFLTKLILGLVKIQILKKKFKKENFEGISFYQTNLEEAPFSFFKNLFWKNSIEINSDLGRQILKHEMVHIEQKHSWDKIFLEIITALFWFNPFFYLIKKEINLIHEYLADKKALKNSDTKAFAQMLLASHFSGKMLPATSPFLSSNLKKRLTMLKKSKTKFSYARRILALPLLFTLAFLYLVNAKNKEIKTTNKEIENLVSKIKKDTITYNDIAYGKDGTEIYKENPELFFENDSLANTSLQLMQRQIDAKQKSITPLQESYNLKNEEAKKLSNELRIKSDKMSKFNSQRDFDKPQFKALDEEISKLGSKIDEIYNQEDFKNNQKLLDKNYVELDQLYAKLDQYYNSDAFTSKIKASKIATADVEKKINSPEFKKKIADAEKQAQKKAEKVVNSPKFKKQIADAEKKAKEAEKLANSAEFKQRMKDAETAAKDSQTALRDSQISLKDSQISLNDSKNSSLNVGTNPNIFIDEKPSTNEEMQKLDPNKIESMHVFKKGFEGKKNGEIYIKLKK